MTNLERKAIKMALEMFDVECMCGICKLGKREWVGLTDEECEKFLGGDAYGATIYDIRAIEAKLKEKNGG